MGLRERKKAMQRRRLLEAAVSRLRAAGEDGWRVSDVARDAEVSEATFYNYFPGKDALLSEWARETLARALEEAAAPAPSGPGLRRRLRGAVRSLAEALAGERRLHAAAWSRVRPVEGRASPAGLRARRAAAGLLQAAQEGGEVRGDWRADELGDLLCDALETAVARALAADASEAPAAGLAAAVQRPADLILDGARRRHERIRASAAARPAAGGA